MILNLFSQFSSPSLLGLPLILIAMLMPWLLFPTPSNRWLPNRLIAVQTWFVKAFTKQIFLPLNTPGHKWAFLLTSIMVFILSMNLLGLLPYTFTPTTQLSLNLGLAVPLWLATVAIGFRNQMTASLGHLLPEGTPTPLIPVLIIIETISLFIRPLALGVRLTANLTAGHLLIQLISMATMAMASTSIIVSSLTFITLLLLTILEIAVAMIQAYVFVLLLSLYLQENS
uniref:ATP synthase subunit a n=1 Tax=Microhyla taraiensis TaxID=1962504 RepID=A0A345WK03_9NEOB|nr:ATP synthase F0 subunit 6 [Microhyla taraiensis]AXJ93409.1 ATP synthase F0 subunit 6 [Microhyla taraiensis]